MRESKEVGSRNPVMGSDTYKSRFLGTKSKLNGDLPGVEMVTLRFLGEARLLEYVGVCWVGLEADLEFGVVGGPVAELGTGFRFTGEFFAREKDLQRPVELMTGTFMPKDGLSRR
jgi:hypothetical protein